jgi:hypothetical protein
MNGLGLVSLDHHSLAQLFKSFNETVETQLTGSILPLSLKFFVASQRILNFSRNFGTSSLFRIIFFHYSDGTVSVFKNSVFISLKAVLWAQQKGLLTFIIHFIFHFQKIFISKL